MRTHLDTVDVNIFTQARRTVRAVFWNARQRTTTTVLFRSSQCVTVWITNVFVSFQEPTGIGYPRKSDDGWSPRWPRGHSGNASGETADGHSARPTKNDNRRNAVVVAVTACNRWRNPRGRLAAGHGRHEERARGVWGHATSRRRRPVGRARASPSSIYRPDTRIPLHGRCCTAPGTNTRATRNVSRVRLTRTCCYSLTCVGVVSRSCPAPSIVVAQQRVKQSLSWPCFARRPDLSATREPAALGQRSSNGCPRTRFMRVEKIWFFFETRDETRLGFCPHRSPHPRSFRTLLPRIEVRTAGRNVPITRRRHGPSVTAHPRPIRSEGAKLRFGNRQM